MPARVLVLAGPAGSGKSQRLLDLYRAALAERPPEACLWLTPNHGAAREVRRQLLQASRAACLGPGVSTFEQLAFRIVEAAPQPARPLEPLAKRRLLRAIVDAAHAAGELAHFAAIAESRGFVDLVAEWITEFKRVEIWPEEFEAACRRRGLAPKDRELLLLYTRYQAQLHAHDLFDSEGRLWSARELVRSGQVRPFERVRFAVVDGFTDFTRTQHELLEGLAAQLDDLHIALPLEEHTAREDLFAKTRATLKALEERHRDLRVEWLPRRARAAWPALGHLEAELFQDPRQIGLAPDSAGLEIIAAGGRLNELEIVARRIKRLLVEGDPTRGATHVPAEEIAVVFRSLAEWAPLVREVFAQFGIPVAIEAEPPLVERPAIAALLNVVRLDQEDWSFRRLLSVVGNNYFRPAWAQWRAGAALAPLERAIRRLQIPSGKRQLLDAITRSIERADARLAAAADAAPEHTSLAEERARRGDLAAAGAVLTQLAVAFDALPRRATLDDWRTALVQLANAIGWTQSLDTDDNGSWRELRDALDRLARFETHTGSPRTLSRAEFYQLLADVTRWHRPRQQVDDAGCVSVLSAATARALSIPYLFLAGLTERSFPSAIREDRLYSELDYRRLRDAGLSLVLRAEHNQEEMLLFYELATRATRRLTLSYPALDERGEPLLASPFLIELERAFHAAPIARHVESGLSPVQRNDEPAGVREYRLRAVDLALEGEPRSLAALCQSPSTAATAGNILAAIRTTRERARREPFGPYEGVLAGEAARAQLAERYGDAHLWSPSQLEQYAGCPFRFFAQHVLGIEPVDELRLEIDHARRGWLLHETLAVVHRRLRAQDLPTDLAAEITSALEELTGVRHTLQSLEGALAEIDRRVIALWCERYAEQHAGYGALWADFDEAPAPAHFEVSFGLPEVSDDALSTAEPLILSDEQTTARLGGRIDRIDLAQRQGRVVFNVIDYKTGYVPSGKQQREFRATALQLDLYALVAEDLLLAEQGAIPWSAGYWQIRKRGYQQPLALAVDDDRTLSRAGEWEERRARLVHAILSLARAVRAGQFPIVSADDDCTSRCAFRTVCRVHHVRALEKTWSPIEPSN